MVVDEEGANTTEDKREKTSLLRLALNVATIHENIFSARVSMKVAVNCQLSFFSKVDHELFCVVNSGVQRSGRSFPAAVQITAGQRAAIVAVDHAVGVEHWNYFENEVLAQQFSFK